MKKEKEQRPGFLRRTIARLGRGIALVFILLGIPLFIIGLILLLIPLIGWIVAIPLLVAGALITFIGIMIAAKTAVPHQHVHQHQEYYKQHDQHEVEVKGNLVCYRCGSYISEHDMICPQCGAKQ